MKNLIALLLIPGLSFVINRLHAQSESEPNDSFATADAVSFGSPVSGTLSPNNDLDYYQVQVSRAGILDIFVNNIANNIDMDLFLYDANQVQLDRDLGGNGENVGLVERVCTPGTYYILLTDNESSTTPYNLTVNFDASDVYECNDSFNDATPIAFGSTIQATIRDHGDEDYYRLDVTQAGVIQVLVNNVASNIDMDLFLYDGNQVQLDRDLGSNAENVGLAERVCTPGTYYVLLTDDESSPTLYNLTVNFDTSDSYECNDSFSEATAIAFGTTLQASIRDHGDEDYYQLNVTQPGIIEVFVNNVPSNIDMDLFLYNEDQVQLDRDLGNDAENVGLVERVCTPGVYYILLTDNESSPDLYELTVNFDATDIYECNDSFNDATPIAFGTTLQASIRDHGDEDYYRLEVTQAGVIEIFVNNVPSNIDMDLILYDENQERIDSDLGSDGENVQLIERVCTPGTYYVLLTDNESSADQYNLTINFDDRDVYECNDTFEDAARVPCNEFIQATIRSAGDNDYYIFNTSQAGTLNVSVTDVASNIDLTARIFDSQQQQVGDGESVGNGDSINEDWALPAAGDYYLLLTDNESSNELYTLFLGCPGIVGTKQPTARTGSIVVGPNPVQKGAAVYFSTLVDYNKVEYLKVVDVSGRVVIEEKTIGRLPIALTTNQLPAGHYQVVLSLDGQMHTTPLIVQ